MSMFFAMREFRDEYDRPFHRRIGRPMHSLASGEKLLKDKKATGYVCKDRSSNVVSVIRDGQVTTSREALLSAL